METEKPFAPESRQFDILIADDNWADFVLLREGFLEAGASCNLHYAVNGMEAINFLEQHRHKADLRALDLVVLDIRMPQASGLEVLEYMQSHPGLGDVPVVVISGIFGPGERATAARAGALCFQKSMTLEGWEDLAAQAYAFASSGRRICTAA